RASEGESLREFPHGSDAGSTPNHAIRHPGHPIADADHGDIGKRSVDTHLGQRESPHLYQVRRQPGEKSVPCPVRAKVGAEQRPEGRLVKETAPGDRLCLWSRSLSLEEEVQLFWGDMRVVLGIICHEQIPY